jgi:hypothetical protein
MVSDDTHGNCSTNGDTQNDVSVLVSGFLPSRLELHLPHLWYSSVTVLEV